MYSYPNISLKFEFKIQILFPTWAIEHVDSQIKIQVLQKKED